MGFKFKQFAIEQDKCGMKVSTDGVILGAWAGRQFTQNQANHPINILDIGTGTGLLALMLAQRFSKSDLDAQITAIEIDQDAFAQASQNVRNSPWANNINLIHEDFLKWSAQSVRSFDLIVCNPPYFNNGEKADCTQRRNARHDDHLSFHELLEATHKIIVPNGTLEIIIPTSELGRFQSECKCNNWEIIERLTISPNKNKVANRVILKCKKSLEASARALKTKSEGEVSNLIIRNLDNSYHPSFVALCKDFYLKL